MRSLPGFERFMDKNFEPVRRTLALSLGDAHRAEEVAQDAFLAAFERWARVSQMDRPVAWVYTVALNKARRELRARPTTEPSEEPVPDIASSVTVSISLASALATLPARQRTAVVLRFLADLSVAEIAEAMGCAEGTVKSTLHSALDRMRLRVEGEDYGR